MTGRVPTPVVATLFFIVVASSSAAMNDYVLYVATLAAWSAAMAVSFDVLLGYTGYLSLAHGAIYGVGAYTCGILTARLGWSFWMALPACGLISAAIGAIVAAIAFRTRGLYFAVLTLGIGLIGFQLFVVMTPLTGGISGFVGIPSPPAIPGLGVKAAQNNLLLALLLLWVTYVCASIFVRSRIGIACLGVREDVLLAQALGIRVSLARLAAFTFSAFFVGVAGALYAATSNFVGPDSFAVMTTGFQIVVLVVVGGMGTLWGPVLGAALLTVVPEALRVANTWSLLAYGVLLLVFILFAPKGIAGLLRSGWTRYRERSPARPGREGVEAES